MKRWPALGVMLLAFPSQALFAGGWFIISMGQPGAHSDVRAHSAAFVVRVYGCSATQADVTATAEGLLNGQRQSIPLHPFRLAGGRDTVLCKGETQPAPSWSTANDCWVEDWPSYSVAIPRQWPSEGTWIIRVVASTTWRSQSALVVLGPHGINRAKTRIEDSFQAGELEAALHDLDSSHAQIAAAR